MKLKYYNSTLGIGLNNWKEIYLEKEKVWLPAKAHVGRLVYGNTYIPFTKVRDAKLI